MYRSFPSNDEKLTHAAAPPSSTKSDDFAGTHENPQRSRGEQDKTFLDATEAAPPEAPPTEPQ